nr:hypothetical protein [Micromonospora pallida]
MSEMQNQDGASGTRGVAPRSAGGSRAIDVSAAGVRIDGTLLELLTVPALTALLGTPRVEPPDEPTDANGSVRSSWVIWDESGIRATTKDGEQAGELSIELADDPVENEKRAASRFFPAGGFPGTFTIDGRPPIEAVSEEKLRKARAFLSTKVGQREAELFLSETECGEIRRMEFPEWYAKSESGELAEIVRSAAHPFSRASILHRVPKPVKKPSGKWKLQAATEPVLEFASFPFRLAIIQELMYEQELLEPRFDVHDFAQDQGAKSFDPHSFGDRMVPAVRSWFRRLPIPARLAESVETLVLDGGNDIYLQLIPLWDGEDDSFMIKTLKVEDLAPFTRLRTIEDIGGLLGPRARAALAAAGIAVE